MAFNSDASRTVKVACGAAALALTASTAFAPSGAGALSSSSSSASPAALRGAPQVAARSEARGVSGTAAAAAAGITAAGMLAGSRRQRRNVRTQRYQAVQSVEQKKDLTGMLPDCPSTVWNADDIDVRNVKKVKETMPLVIDASELSDLKKGAELEWFQAKRTEIMEQLTKHGAILFRNFDTMTDSEGFRSFYESLQLNPCLDPIHTSGLRDMTAKKDAVYEAVNKPSLAQHYIGLHNESTFVKTAEFGAFVCFQPATEGGGEFTLADGAKILENMDKDVLERIYKDKVRISVSNLDLNFLGALPDDMQSGAMDWFKDLIFKGVAPKFDMDLEMVYGADNSNKYRLQAIEHAQSPINRHPVTGQPVWFCNMHNHSRYLRDRRPCTVPEVGMTDVYKGDLGTINYDDVRKVNEACEKSIVEIMMKKGDVILLDNYRVLHGRKTFKGERSHCVTWFESCGEPRQRDNKKDTPDDFMNNLINKTLV